MPSPKNIQQVEEIRNRFSEAEVVVLTDYHGLSVSEINELRRRFREAKVGYHVYKNRLVKIVADEIGITGLDEYLKGPTAIATSIDHVTPVKVILDFINEFQKLEIKGGIVGTKVISAEEVKDLTKLPSKEELIVKALGGLQSPIVSMVSVLHQVSPLTRLVNVLHRGSPLIGFVNVLSGTVRNLSYVLQAILDQKKTAEEV